MCMCVCSFCRCGRSAVYRTREMAARALVPFVLVTQVPSIVVTLLQELPPEPGPRFQHNHIHGTLLQVWSHTCQHAKNTPVYINVHQTCQNVQSAAVKCLFSNVALVESNLGPQDYCGAEDSIILLNDMLGFAWCTHTHTHPNTLKLHVPKKTVVMHIYVKTKDTVCYSGTFIRISRSPLANEVCSFVMELTWLSSQLVCMRGSCVFGRTLWSLCFT